MCGIVGGVGIEESAFDRAVETLKHRGPDAQDRKSVGLATFGHTRLAIVDLSERGRQPMTTGSGRTTITYNGELYNTQELRARLDSRRISFRGTSDTEVLVECCEAFGVEQTLAWADGMFAFGLWDRETQTLTLTRDRFGEKPIYWCRIGSGLAFASELKALVDIPGFDHSIDSEAATAFRSYGYVPYPRSIYRGTAKLGPGQMLRYRMGDASPSITTWWDAVDKADAAKLGERITNLEAATDEAEALLARTVKSRLVGDVECALFLSGGIDSTIVAMFANEGRTNPLQTFTIGLADDNASEAPEAERTAAFLGTKHTSHIVTPSEAQEIITKLPTIYDEPFADSSQIPTHLVSVLAAKSVKVALSGDGGDELFGGYNRYVVASGKMNRIRELPFGVRSLGSKALLATPVSTIDTVGSLLQRTGIAKNWKGGVGDRTHKFARALRAKDSADLYRELITTGGPLAPANAPLPVGAHRAFSLSTQLLASERMMLADTVSYLVDDIMTKVDRASMATSLETRAPFLSPEIFNFVWRLDPVLRVNAGEGKVVLRALLRRRLPVELWERPKAGFGIPIADWLRGPLRPWASDLLSKSNVDRVGIYPGAEVEKLWAQHLGGKRNVQYELWNVLMLQAWADRWSR
jgi:asparagine synthase (glutamine-hydrolysing)